MTGRESKETTAIQLLEVVLYHSGLEEITTDRRKMMLAFRAAGEAYPGVRQELGFVYPANRPHRRLFWLTNHRATDSLNYHIWTLLFNNFIGHHAVMDRSYSVEQETLGAYVETVLQPEFGDEEWEALVEAGQIFRERLEAYEELTLQEAYALEFPS